MWNKEKYFKEREEMLKMSDPKNAEFFKKLTPGVEFVIGLKAPQIREIVKRILKDDPISYIETARPLYYEEIIILGAVMAGTKAEGMELIAYIEKYHPYNTNWATNDSFAARLKQIAKKREVYFEYVKDLTQSFQPYKIRLGLTLLMNYYLTDEYIKRVLEISGKQTLDHYYVKMGNAWLLATALAKEYTKTEAFLHTTTLDKWTVNKAIQKAIESRRITPEQKEHLRSLKRK